MTDWLHPGHPDYPYEEVMTDTPGTPLTPEQITAEHRLCGPKYEGCYSHWPMAHCRADGMSWPCDVERLATLDRERRERVDPDLLAKAMHESDFHARYHGDVDENDRIMARDLAERYNRRAATPDHTVGGEERCLCGTDAALARGDRSFVRLDIVCPKHDARPR